MTTAPLNIEAELFTEIQRYAQAIKDGDTEAADRALREVRGWYRMALDRAQARAFDRSSDDVESCERIVETAYKFHDFAFTATQALGDNEATREFWKQIDGYRDAINRHAIQIRDRASNAIRETRP